MDTGIIQNDVNKFMKTKTCSLILMPKVGCVFKNALIAQKKSYNDTSCKQKSVELIQDLVEDWKYVLQEYDFYHLTCKQSTSMLGKDFFTQ